MPRLNTKKGLVGSVATHTQKPDTQNAKFLCSREWKNAVAIPNSITVIGILNRYLCGTEGSCVKDPEGRNCAVSFGYSFLFLQHSARRFQHLAFLETVVFCRFHHILLLTLFFSVCAVRLRGSPVAVASKFVQGSRRWPRVLRRLRPEETRHPIDKGNFFSLLSIDEVLLLQSVRTVSVMPSVLPLPMSDSLKNNIFQTDLDLTADFARGAKVHSEEVFRLAGCCERGSAKEAAKLFLFPCCVMPCYYADNAA